MAPEQALEEQIALYRMMTGEERLAIALRLHELSSEIAHAGLRSQFPDANTAEVDPRSHSRLALTREL